MTKDVKAIFKWANQIGDANITHRILGKAMPFLIKEGLFLKDDMINSSESLEVSEEIFKIIKDSAESLLGTAFEEEL